MSFVLVYNIAGRSAIPHHSLTGIIGSDGLVYWLCKDVAIVLGNSRTYGRNLSNIRVRDVTGPLDNVDPKFLQKRVISHIHLSILLKKARRSTVREFEQKINSPDTQVTVHPGRHLTDLKDPTYLVISKNRENQDYFFVWLEMFKEKVLENLYVKMPVLDDDFVASFIKYAEQPETIPSTMPAVNM